MLKYICWTKHGEKGVMMKDNEEVDCDGHFSSHTGFGAFDDDTTMEEPEAEAAENDPTDDLGHALRSARKDCKSEKERMKFQQISVILNAKRKQSVTYRLAHYSSKMGV